MAGRTDESTRTRMTAAEFLALPESNRLEELLHGEYILNPPPSDAHQKIVGRTHILLNDLITGGELRIAPTGVYLDEENFVEPDVFWVSPHNPRCQLREGRYWHGAPDLVVEVLSPGTARHDRVIKFSLYEQHGVREYWIIDPDTQYVEVWRLEGELFALQGSYGPGRRFESAVLSVQVDVSKVFEG